ncbi:MAG: hypothetical protein ACRDGL_09905 [Candidatus Limnocylindrales bacterium]
MRGWLSEPQLALFEAMHPADRRHGLDVVAALRAAGHEEPDLLLAGLFHDASKGPSVRLVHRVGWSLGERYGAWVWRTGARLPGFAAAFERIRRHPEGSAELALAAGCSARTAELIRHQDRPVDPILGPALLLADEAS